MISNQITKEYDINNFYIGELTIISNNSNEETENLKLLETGAILLENRTISNDKEWSKKTKQAKVLTVFYYINDNYLCLHNDNIYTINEIKIFNNITKYLPKISFSNKNKLTIREILSVFNTLFQSNVPLNEIYNNQKYKLTDFYLGTLVLPTEFISLDNPKDHRYLNQPLNYILEKSTKSRKISSKSITSATENPLSLPLGRYIHTYYKCLFLKLPNNQGYYNINNFQIYTKEIKSNLSVQERPVGESYCEDLISITEMIDKSQLGNKVSIKKILSKF